LATPDQQSKKQPTKITPDKTPDKTPKPQPTVVAQPVALGVKKPVKKPLEIFFSQYSRFRYQPKNSSILEFYRLCDEYGWRKWGAEREAARDKFDLAMKNQFNYLYGTDEKDINNWIKLCCVLSIDPLPNSIWKCREVSS
jgi:hypothetical protein